MKFTGHWMTPRRTAALTGALVSTCVWFALSLWLRPQSVSVPARRVSETLPPALVRPLSAQSLALLQNTLLLQEKPDRKPLEAREMVKALGAIPPEEMEAGCESCLRFARNMNDAAPLRALLERWIALAPADAFNWLIHRIPGELGYHSDLLDGCGHTWAALDGAGFVRWWRTACSTLSEDSAQPNLREEISVRMAAWLAAECPSEALRYLAATPDIRKKDGNRRIIDVNNVLNSKQFDAATLVSTVAEVRDALQLMVDCQQTNEAWLPISRQVMNKWAALNGGDMQQWLLDNPGHPLAGEGREILAVYGLEHSADPAAAADAWLADRGDCTESEVMARIIEKWSLTDLNAAGRWLDSLPRTPQRWDAVEQFSKRAVTEDPAAAFTWLATVEDPTQRRARIARVFDAWERRKPAEAEAFLRTQPFDAAQTQWIAERRAVR